MNIKRIAILFIGGMIVFTTYDYFFENGNYDHIKNAVLSAILTIFNVAYSAYTKDGREQKKV